MTQTFQERLIAKIIKTAEDKGFEVSTANEWGNVGSVFVHYAGEIAPSLTVRYNVQGSGSYKLSLTAGERRVPSQIGRADYFDFYHDGAADRTRFWECYWQELSALRRARPMSFAAFRATGREVADLRAEGICDDHIAGAAARASRDGTRAERQRALNRRGHALAGV